MAGVIVGRRKASLRGDDRNRNMHSGAIAGDLLGELRQAGLIQEVDRLAQVQHQRSRLLAREVLRHGQTHLEHR